MVLIQPTSPGHTWWDTAVTVQHYIDRTLTLDNKVHRTIGKTSHAFLVSWGKFHSWAASWGVTKVAIISSGGQEKPLQVATTWKLITKRSHPCQSLEAEYPGQGEQRRCLTVFSELVVAHWGRRQRHATHGQVLSGFQWTEVNLASAIHFAGPLSSSVSGPHPLRPTALCLFLFP